MSMTLEREQTVTSPVAPALAGLALSDAIADIAAEIKPSVVLVGQGGSHGAGVIWRSDGIVVTNRHVVRDDRIDVILDDGRKFTGIVAARHPDRDLAVDQDRRRWSARRPPRRFQHRTTRSNRHRDWSPAGTS